MYLSVCVILQTLATVLTYWTFRKWIHSSSWLFVFWLLQLIAVIIEFRSVMIRVRTVQLHCYSVFTQSKKYIFLHRSALKCKESMMLKLVAVISE